MKLKFPMPLLRVALVLLASGLAVKAADQFIVYNLSEGRRADAFAQIHREFTNQPTGKVRVGNR